MRILHMDIERSPVIATIWGLWGVNVGIDQLIGDSEILCCAMSWEGEKEVHFVSKWKNGRRNMLRAIHKKMTEADAIVTYNGDAFDLKVLNMEFAKFNIGPPAPYKSIDLLKTVRKRFKLTSNKLDYALRYFKLGNKLKTPGHKMWLDVMDGKKEAQDMMEKYNRHDVTEMKKLFTFLQGWGIVNMPNRAVYERERVCPECGGNHFQRRGTRVVNLLTYPRYRCYSKKANGEVCGHWFRGTKAIAVAGVKPDVVPIR